MGIRRKDIPATLRPHTKGMAAAQRRVAEGLARGPRVYACSGWARVLVPRGATAWTLGRLILAKASLWDKPPHEVDMLLAHEFVHVAQWRERSSLRFVAAYVSAYLGGRLRGLGHWDAYRLVPAEEEAFSVQADLEALRGSAAR